MNQNPPRSHNDLETLEQITNSTIPLESLSQEEVNALGDIFRIQTAGSYAEVMQRVKRVLLEVLVLERQQFAAYLQLPKFKSLPARTITALQIYFQSLWTAFSSQRELQSKPAQSPCDPLTVPPYQSPSAQGLKQQGRVSPFDYYRAYQPYQKFGMDQHKMAFSPFPYYYNFQNYAYPSPYQAQQPPQLKYASASLREEGQAESERELGKEKVDKGQREKEKGDKADKGEKAEKSQKGDKIGKSEKSEVSISAPPKSKQGSESNSEPSKAPLQQQTSKRQVELPSQNGKKVQLPPSNIVNLRFLHCACTGYPIETSQRSFQCQECKNLFHFSCLHLPTSQSKSCPLCTLTRNHIFTEAFPRAIKSGWFEVGHKECFITKLHLDEDQLGIFRRYMAMLAEKEKERQRDGEGEGLYSIQFRILRINEKAKVKPGRKIIKTSFPLLISELRKIESRHWIQLKLKQITEPSLIFYIMTMIKLKDRVKLTSDYLVLQPKQNVIEQWGEQQRVSGQQIIMNMYHPITRRPIQLPIRGQFCDHLQCEDLIYFYELFQSTAFEANNRLLCTFCKKAYTAHSKFTTDPTLYAMLQNRPNNARKIKYQNGKLEWLPYDPSAGSEEGEGSSDSQS